MKKRVPHLCRVVSSPWPGVFATDTDSAVQCDRHWHTTFGFGFMGRGAHRSMSGRGIVDAQAGEVITSVDASRPDLVESFTEKTFIAMIEGVRHAAIAGGLTTARRFNAGIRDLRRATRADGVFCYTFFKGVGVLGNTPGGAPR